jgi:hypothetical protein
MPNSKKDNPDTRIPYEPPRLFDLGGGVAYAADACVTGGSPIDAKCTAGTVASTDKCDTGGIAGDKCDSGGTAAKKCSAGDFPSE